MSFLDEREIVRTRLNLRRLCTEGKIQEARAVLGHLREIAGRHGVNDSGLRAEIQRWEHTVRAPRSDSDDSQIAA